MGDNFAFVFDIIVGAILLIFGFVGWRRGFARVVLGLVSSAVAFTVALLCSQPLSQYIYDSFIETAIEDKISDSVAETIEDFTLGDIPEVDFSKIKLDGVPIDEYELDYAGTRKAVVDFSKLDLSGVGISEDDLKKLGIKGDVNLSNLNGKTAEVSMDDVKEHGLGKVAAAQYIAVNVMEREDMAKFEEVANVVGKYLPTISSSAAGDSTGVSAVRTAALTMFETKGNLKDAVLEGVIEPNCVMLIRSIAFGVIFLLISLILRIVAAVTKLVSKIPVIGKVNSALGLVMGLLEGLIAVFIVCIIARLIVMLGGANFILFNQSAVDSTVIFKSFYNFDFLNFLK